MAAPLHVCILAAGIGSRMKSDNPKVLQTLGGRSLLARLLDKVAVLQPAATHVVVGQGADLVKNACGGDVNWVRQEKRLGTGHAVQQVAPHLDPDARVLILLGDAPLIEVDTMRAMLEVDADLAVLTVNMDNPYNYGRILRRGDQVVAIVEEVDATTEQRSIKEINTGVMAAKARCLIDWLSRLDNNNAQQEYLLTDIVKHANEASAKVAGYIADDPIEVTGVNTFTQLAALERALQMKTAEELMEAGVRVMDPGRLDIRGNLKAGKGVVLDINVIIEGEVELGDDVTIGPHCVVRDSRIGNGSIIKANSVVEEATVGNDCSVGPFARLRPGAELADEVAVGNFVEIKKSKLGKGTKASHLAYLGDATIGEDVNIGAGTITCNYDGENKHETHIGDAAFIGSNSSLVAPVKIGPGSTIGAGSTITKDVDSQVLALGRGKQKQIANWQRPTKK